MTIGVGIEFGPSIVRAVLLDLDRPDDLVAAEYAVDFDDDDAVERALVRATGLVGSEHPGRVPARLAVAPDNLLLQSVDVTGRGRDEVLELAAAAADLAAADSMMIVDDGSRRRLVLVRGHAHVVERLGELARRAGFDDAEVEPAPIALGRVLGGGRTLVRRSTDATTTWSALYDDGLPIVASVGPAGLAGWPTLSSVATTGRHDDPEELLTADMLTVHLDDAVERSLARGPRRSGLRDADGWPLEPPDLVQTGMPHPSFPRHDLRAAGRIAVALGAAAGAARASERHRRVERLAPLATPPRPARRAWALEPITEDAALPKAPELAPGNRTGTLRPAERRSARTSVATNRARRVARRYRRQR